MLNSTQVPKHRSCQVLGTAEGRLGSVMGEEILRQSQADTRSQLCSPRCPLGSARRSQKFEARVGLQSPQDRDEPQAAAQAFILACTSMIGNQE